MNESGGFISARIAATPYDAAYTGAVGVAAGDLDDDGKSEIVTAPGANVPLTITVSPSAGRTARIMTSAVIQGW